MRDDFQWLFRTHLNNILIKWLTINNISQRWYQENVHSIKNEVNQLIRDNLSDAISRYEQYYLKNPNLNIKEYFLTNYGIDKFNRQWNKQINQCNNRKVI